jgi:hypothetical protein
MSLENDLEEIFSKARLRIIINEAINIAKREFTNYMRVRTGFLRRTLDYDYNETTKGIRIYTQTVYGRAQEFGAEITPKKARRLWIPLPPNLTSAGVIRQAPRDVFDKGFISKDTFYLKQGKNIIPYFKLKNETKIKPKLWIKQSLMKVDKKTVEEKTRQLVKNALKNDLRNIIKKIF